MHVRNGNFGARTRIHHADVRAQLSRQSLNDAGAQSRPGKFRLHRHPNAIIRHRQSPVQGVCFVINQYLAFPIIRESMLERIYHQLGDDQTKTDGRIGCRDAIICPDLKRKLVMVADHRCADTFT